MLSGRLRRDAFRKPCRLFAHCPAIRTRQQRRGPLFSGRQRSGHFGTQAALANGTAGHADDFDDTQLAQTPDRIYGLLTHPTVPALAATLAVAQETGASGKELLTAFCGGFEVECKIAEAMNPRHYIQGFHSTATIGIFAAATGAAKLYGLSAGRPGTPLASQLQRAPVCAPTLAL